RWDCFVYSLLCIDIHLWKGKEKKYFNGKDGVVKVAHAPNHRYVKGTEFLIDAVEKLKAEDFKVELLILEKKSNEEVRRILCEEADILVEKLTYSVYGLTGIEGMAAGLPVISNIEENSYTRAFRVYGYLDECPLVNASPENIYEVLKSLIQNVELRKKLSEAGVKFVKKYHSYEAFSKFFDLMVDKIWFNKDVNLMNCFHPLNPNRLFKDIPKIENPVKSMNN
ncbi:MAG: aminotransferase, partial [Bacteroidia bacterium]|nr:aminotransferase [Bacteroidia bacterium]